MFRTLNTVRSTFTARRFALVAAPLAALGATVSTASAADRDGWWHRRPSIVIHAQIPAPQVVVERRVVHVDEVPAALSMTAYQSKDRIIVVLSGTNRGSGFHTALTQVGDDWSPTLVLRNTAPDQGCVEGASAFTLTAGIHASRDASRLCIRIGDRFFDVPVTCVQSIS